MVRIINGRSTGKTSQLMLIAKENNAIFVCANPRAMEVKAKAYGIEGIKFLSYGEFSTILLHTNDKYVIDELENFVKEAFGGKFLGYTISNND